VTTVTQVQALFISYIAYGSEYSDIYAGSYLFDTYIASANLVHTPPANLTSNMVDFYGLNGFILNNNEAGFRISSSWSGNSFKFETNSNYRYLSYNYIFILGSSCSDCKGYPIYFENNCVAYCPTTANFNGKTCVTCIASQRWNGT